MTQLVHYRYDIQTTWENVTQWLDTVLFGEHLNHRTMLRLSDDVELLETELYDLDRELGHLPPTPAEAVALFALNLRYRDLHGTLERKWSDQRVRASAIRALEGIHTRFLGPIAESRRHLAVYAASRSARSNDVMGFIESHRLEHNGIWTRDPWDRAHSITAVAAPLWTWDVLDAMTPEPYIQRPGNQAMLWHYSKRHNEHMDPFKFWVGEPAVTRSEHAEEMLSLWAPDDADSPFKDIPAAVEALERL